MIKIIFILSTFLVERGLSNHLVGYDCTGSSTNVTTISIKNVESCPDFDSSQSSSVVSAMVLAVKRHTHVMVTRCLLKKSSLFFRCGMHSHVALVKGSLSLEDVIPMTSEECQRIVMTGRYVDWTNQIISGVTMNNTIKFSNTDIGSVDNTGNCEGSTVVVGGETFHKMVKTNQVSLTVSQQLELVDLQTRKIITKEGIYVDYHRGAYYSDVTGIMLWEIEENTNACGKTLYDLIYTGPANLTVLHDKSRVLTVESYDRRFALILVKATIICGMHSYSTEHNELSVIVDPSHSTSFKPGTLDVSDMNIYLNTNLKFVYVERNVKNRTTELYQIFTKRYCDLNERSLMLLLSTARTDPEEFAWIYSKQPGYTAIVRGEVVHLIQCSPVSVQYRPTTECFMELPVTYKNQTYFMKPTTRILVSLGTPVPCNPLTPTMFLAGDIWIKTGGESYVPKPPKTLSSDFDITWDYGDVVSSKHIGYLSTEEISAYHRSIIAPLERSAITNTFASRIETRGGTSSQGLDFAYGLNAEEFGKHLEETVLYKIYGWFSWVLHYAGGILGVMLIYEMLCSVFRFLMNVLFLYNRYGFSKMLIISFFGSLTKHVLYGDPTPLRDIFKKAKKPAKDEDTDGIEKDIIEMVEKKDNHVYPLLPSAPTNHPHVYP